jgi:hypothetical protein
MWKKWMMMLWLLSLTACVGNVGGSFCTDYVVVDMPSSEAIKLERRYQERILANETHQFHRCK